MLDSKHPSKPLFIPQINCDLGEGVAWEEEIFPFVDVASLACGGHFGTQDSLDASLVSKTGIYVISDEVYEHILFDGRVHISLGSHPILREQTFVCGSFGKTFHVTGWKIGYCIAPKTLIAEFRKIHQYLTFSTVTPIQYALAEYLENPQHYLDLPAFYQKKRDLFVEGLKSTPFTFQASQGSFFQLVSYAHLSKKSDVVIAEQMTRQLKVACIPVSVFYSTGQDYQVLRFCFAKKEEELEEALRRIQKIEILFD